MEDEEIVVASFDDFAGVGVKPEPKRREELYRGVVEYSMDGIFLNAYDNATKASEATGVSSSYISLICNGKSLCTHTLEDNRIFLFRGGDIAQRLDAIHKDEEKRRKLSIHATKCREVWEYTLSGRLVFKWPTVKAAAKSFGVSSNNIYRCCTGKRLYIDNRIFLWPNEDVKPRVSEVKVELYRLSKKRPKYREVDMYDLEGNFIKAFPCANAASRELGIHVSNITRCCNGHDGHHQDNVFTTRGKIFLWVGSSISDRLEAIKQSKERIKYEFK